MTNTPTPLARPTTGIARFLPFMSWMRSYRRSDAKSDLSAGLTTAIMLVPQGMAYAMLAGLPPVVGLYASVVPLVAYSLFGTSRQLAVGPVAMDSLLVAQALAPLAVLGSDQYIAYAVLLALLVGIIQLSMGILRLGFLMNFLSNPVVSGFTSAAALIIGFSQLKHILGVSLPRSKNVLHVIQSALESISDWNWPTIAIALASIVFLIAAKRWRPKAPRALLVVVGGSLVVWAGGLAEAGVATVGVVPSGPPALGLPIWNTEVAGTLLPMALTIALVAIMEAMSVARTFAQKEGYDIDANQELIALGVANVGGALSSAYPVTGGFSRTAVNAQAGAKTPLAGLVTAGIVLLTLLFFTPLFYHLPTAALAAIIMTAVFGLIDIKAIRRLWKVKRSDLVVLVATFAATLGIGIEQGILSGVAMSLAFFVFRTTRPHVAVLGELPESKGVFRNVLRYPNAEQVTGVLLVRIDAQFYFGNTTFLKGTLERLEREATSPLHTVILDASGINQLDSSAASALEELVRSYAQRNIRLFIACAKGPVRDILERVGLSETLAGRLPQTLAQAVTEAKAPRLRAA
ncbi:MAG: SulP family sulfate permease [Polyangiales bacterium]|jgi:SulP family sulfate permease